MVSWAEPYTPGEGDGAPRQVEPHPKPVKRHKASQAEWAEIRESFEHATCVHCGLAAQSLHHIVPKSQGGDDVYENLAPLCGDGTRGCHGILESHSPGWERVAASVRPFVLLNRSRCVYVIGKIGWDRFNARYPMLGTTETRVVAPLEPVDEFDFAEKPRKDPWELDFLPPFSPEEVPFG